MEKGTTDSAAGSAGQVAGALPADIVTIGEFQLDGTTGELSNGGNTVTLQPSTFGVLACLVEHAGQVVSNEKLIETVWSGRFVGDDAVHRRIADLRKQLGDDARSPRYIETLSRRGYRLIAPVTDAPPAAPRRVPNSLGLAAVALAVVLGGYQFWERQVNFDRQARVEQIATLAQAGDGFGVYLAIKGTSMADLDLPLKALTEEVLARGRIESNPEGADVWLQRQPGEPWHHVGRTPLEADFPKGIYPIRLTLAGYAQRIIMDVNPGAAFNNADAEPYRVKLPLADVVAQGQVFVQGGEWPTPFIMTRSPYVLDEFLIDRHEVTNADYQRFVDAGGYHALRFWSDYPDAQSTPPSERFLDSTGATGPASWEFGSFATGTETLPVTGVSWYEAQAYSRWAGRPLPTALDWARAALSPIEWSRSIAPAVLDTANIESERLLPAGASGSISANGAVDLVGNAREWTSSVTHGLALVIGGGWDSPRAQYVVPLPIEPLDRSPLNGFRGVTYLGERNAQLTTALDWEFSGEVDYEPVSDSTYAGIRELFLYEEGTVRLDDAKTVRRTDEGDWERWVIELPTADQGPMPVHLFVPKHLPPPFQPIFFMPQSDSYGPSIVTDDIELEDYYLDVLVKNGRALVWPVYSGTHERFNREWSRDSDSFVTGVITEHRHRRNEVGRVIDYLHASPDFDGTRVGMLARGMSAVFMSASILALEPRLQAVVLWGARYPHGAVQRPAFNPATYWPRMTKPVLVTNGRDDQYASRSTDPQRLMALFGTDAQDKRLVLYDGPHWPMPRRELLRDTIDWFDRYLGRPESWPREDLASSSTGEE